VRPPEKNHDSLQRKGEKGWGGGEKNPLVGFGVSLCWSTSFEVAVLVELGQRRKKKRKELLNEEIWGFWENEKHIPQKLTSNQSAKWSGSLICSRYKKIINRYSNHNQLEL